MRQKQAMSGNAAHGRAVAAGNEPVWTACHGGGTMKPWVLTGP
jgi:hypothetical protein